MTPRVAIAVAMLAASLCTLLTPDPAAAQFLGGLFGGDPPPRPPSAVPGRPDAPPSYQAAPPYQAQPSYQAQPQAQPAPPPATQQTTLAPVPLPGRVQSEDLPAPPGAATVAPPPPSPALPRPATAAVGAPGQPAAAPGQLPGQPGQRVRPADEMTQPPAAKIVNPTAVFSGLDKITGRITAFDAAIGETVQFGALQVTSRACYTRPPTETPLTDGFVEVAEVTLQGEVRRIFTGWMFAASPGLHAVEHPIYDVWLTDCKGGVPAVAEVPPPAAAAPPTTPAARTAPPAQQRPPASAAAPAPQRQAQPPRQPAPRPPADATLPPPLMR
jgi:hypothetical protein